MTQIIARGFGPETVSQPGPKVKPPKMQRAKDLRPISKTAKDLKPRMVSAKET